MNLGRIGRVVLENELFKDGVMEDPVQVDFDLMLGLGQKCGQILGLREK